jgi:ABC-type nitrate/sulfonate/bicarbonate transport system substrate-binding protein
MAGSLLHQRGVATATLAAALLLAACGDGAEPPATTPSVPATTTTTAPGTTTAPTTTGPTPLDLRIGVTPSVAYGIPFVLADESTGIGDANGLAVTLEFFATADEALAAAVAGDIDVALPGARSVLAALADGACFVAPLDFIDQDSMRLVGRSDIIGAEDLIGRKVGTLEGGPGQVALRMWLSDEGVAWDEITVVDTRADDLPAALAGGLVDAIIWSEPVPAAALEACGGDDCHYIGEIGASYREVALVNVTCRWQQAHRREGMERLVRAWLEGKEYIRNNLDAAAAITAGRLRLTGDEVTTLWLDRSWIEAWGADLDDSQLSMLEAYGAYMVEAGELAEAPEICAWVSSRWLAEVAPALVSLEEHAC